MCVGENENSRWRERGSGPACSLAELEHTTTSGVGPALALRAGELRRGGDDDDMNKQDVFYLCSRGRRSAQPWCRRRPHTKSSRLLRPPTAVRGHRFLLLSLSLRTSVRAASRRPRPGPRARPDPPPRPAQRPGVRAAAAVRPARCSPGMSRESRPGPERVRGNECSCDRSMEAGKEAEEERRVRAYFIIQRRTRRPRAYY